VQVCSGTTCVARCMHIFWRLWRPGDLLKTLKTRWSFEDYWRCLDLGGVNDCIFLLPPYMCAWSLCLYVESLFLSKSVRPAASLWCTNDPLQSFVGWLKDYFSQKLPKGEIVRFLRVFSFAKISLWSRCGTWCAHIVKTI
jgi:hypothetical protein